MVVRFAAQDGVRPVELFGGERPDHLVRKRHGTEAQEAVCPRANAFVEAIGTADDEGQMPQPPHLQRLQLLRKGHRSVGRSALIE